MKRQHAIAADIERRAFDLIVIGAGINGTGIARDAALRGLRVLLLDKGDLCAGTSAWRDHQDDQNQRELKCSIDLWTRFHITLSQ